MSDELMTVLAKYRQFIDTQYPHLDYIIHLVLTQDDKRINIHTPCSTGMLVDSIDEPFDMEIEMVTLKLHVSAVKYLWKRQPRAWKLECERVADMVSASRMALADALRPLPTPISDAIRWHFVPTE